MGDGLPVEPKVELSIVSEQNPAELCRR